MGEPFRKLLKDFKLGEWMEAADGCQCCEAKYKVRILEVEADGTIGAVEWTITHSPDCPENWEPDESPQTETECDVAGWEFMDEPVTLQGRQYYPLKARANIGPCLECGRLVVGGPLILFIDEGRKGQLDFCFECAKKIGIFDMIGR